MKKIIFLLILINSGLNAWAQTCNAILFTENGEKFTAILNGLRQNDKPETNVKITGLNADYYKLKVIFDNAALGEKNFNMALQFGNEATYSIRKNNKGEYVLRFVSTVPLAEAPVSPSSQPVIVYNPAPVQAPSAVTQTTTTTTTIHNPGDGENMNMNMGVNVGGTGGNISINVSGMDQSSSTTTVVHQTTTSNSSSGNYESTPAPAPVYLEGYNGNIGCLIPMTRPDFESLKQTISAKSFEDTRMTIAKQVLRDHCLFVSQVKEITQLFTFEESKLDFAKYAYDHTYDVGNYFKINDVFTFETSTEELNAYINSKH